MNIHFILTKVSHVKIVLIFAKNVLNMMVNVNNATMEPIYMNNNLHAQKNVLKVFMDQIKIIHVYNVIITVKLASDHHNITVHHAIIIVIPQYLKQILMNVCIRVLHINILLIIKLCIVFVVILNVKHAMDLLK